MTDKPGGITLMHEVENFVKTHRRAPTTDEVYAMVDFRQPGGIHRLCDFVSRWGKGYLVALKRTETASRQLPQR